MIKAITFDLWKTLLCDVDYSDLRVDLLAEILHKEGFSKERNLIKCQYTSVIDFLNDAWEREQRYVSAVEIAEFILRNLDIELPNESKRVVVKGFEEAALNDSSPLMNGAEMVLKSLHNHYRIGLICDSGVTPGKVLRRILEDHAVLQYFSCSIFSDEVGRTKPHPMIFRRAVEKLQVRASEIMHVGDLLETDIAGAKAIGMKTVWFNKRNESQRDKMKFFARLRNKGST